jgi:hypothetical protein
MKRFTVQCGTVKAFHDFVEAMNNGFIRAIGGEWDGNLDALNDYLSWPSELQYELELVDHAQCARALDQRAMAEWLKRKLTTCHPANIPRVQAELAIAESGHGKSLVALIHEIIAANSHVRLVLG